MLGTFIKIKEDRNRYEFVPSSFFSQECYVAKKPSIDLQFSSEGVKKDLSISKIAEVCQLDVDRTAAVIQTLVKTIGSQLKTGAQVALDLQLPGEVYFLISQNGVEFVNKNGIADSLDGNSRRSNMATETSSKKN